MFALQLRGPLQLTAVLELVKKHDCASPVWPWQLCSVRVGGIVSPIQSADLIDVRPGVSRLSANFQRRSKANRRYQMKIDQHDVKIIRLLDALVLPIAQA